MTNHASPRLKIRLFRHVTVASIAAGLVAGAMTTNALAAIAPATQTGTNVVAPVSSAAVNQLLSDAQKAMTSGDVRLALILFKNAVSAAPKNGAVRAQLGIALLEASDPVGAERELRQARNDGAPDSMVLPPLFQTMLNRHEEQAILDQFPDPGASGASAADILKGRALAFQALGRIGDAAASMDRSLALRRDIPGLLVRGRIAEAQNNPAMAKSLDDEALRLDPKNLNALVFKFGLDIIANDYPAAIALSDQLIKQYPRNIGIRLGRIEVFLKLRQDSKARGEVDAILAASQNAPIGLYYKALLLARANDVKGAWKIGQSLPHEFVESEPTIAMVVSQMAISSGDADTGASFLTAALAKFPDLNELRLRLATLRLQQNSPEAAMSTLRPIKDSTDPRTLALLSQVYLKLGKYSDALDALNKLNATPSAGPGVARAIAMVELQAGQAQQALKDLLELAAKQPTDSTIVTPLVAALVQARRFPEALAAADRLGNDPKQRVQANFLRGQILTLKGDGPGALTAFQTALQLDPKSITSLYYRAGVFETLHRFPEAIHDLQAIIAIDPKNVSALVKMAEVQARQNLDKDVRATLANASRLDSANPTPRLALIRYLAIRHDYNGALAASNDMLRAIPNNTDALMLMGESQLALGQKNQAIVTFRKLASLLPRATVPQLLLANALMTIGDQDGAAGALSAAASIDPNSRDVRVAQINFMFAKGDVNGAIGTAKSFQATNPGADSDLLLADALVRGKQLAQASSVLTESLQKNPDNRVLVHLVQLTLLTGDRKKAGTLMSDWLRSNPRDLVVRSQYAAQIMQEGNSAGAAAQYEQIVAQDPDNVSALNNLGWLLQKNDPKRALSLVSHANDLAPNLPDILDTLAMIKLATHDAHGALDAVQHAHALRPNDGEITYHLVLVLDASGRRDAAKGLLKALLAGAPKFDDLAKAQQLSATWH